MLTEAIIFWGSVLTVAAGLTFIWISEHPEWTKREKQAGVLGVVIGLLLGAVMYIIAIGAEILYG